MVGTELDDGFRNLGDEQILVQLNHGGAFVPDPHFKFLKYEGGYTRYHYAIGYDKITYSGIRGMLEELGHKNITKIHYRVPEKFFSVGLRILNDDDDAKRALEGSKAYGILQIYNEHDDATVTCDKVGEGEDDQEIIIDYGDIHQEEEFGYEEESEAASVDDESDEEVIQAREKRTRGSNNELTRVVVDNEIPNEVGSNNEVRVLVANTEGGGYESEYGNSSEYDSPESDDEDNENELKVKKAYPVYHQKNMFKTDPQLGTRFGKVKDLKQLVTCYAMRNGYDTKFLRSGTQDLRAACAEGCPWKLWCSKIGGENSFQIKTMTPEHRCVKNFKVKIANSKFLSGLYQQRSLANPDWKLKDIMQDVLEKYGLRLSLMQCSITRQMAKGEGENIIQEHYAKLWDYANEIIRSNPGSTVKIKADNGVFVRIYICFDACKKGWKFGCRSVIGMDGAFLKGTCKGELLTAVGRDGNNQMFPIAWAVVSDGETKDSWSWFLTLLKDDLEFTQGYGLTFITDQQKGLVPAITELLPLAEHRNYARHLYSNFRKHHGGAHLKLLFWQACKTGTSQEFNNIMAEIKEFSVGAHNWMMERDPKHYARAFFLTHSKTDSVENNMCEVLNAVLREARANPILHMLEDIRVYMMERIVKKRDLMQSWTDTLCQRIRERLEKNKEDHRMWSCTHNGLLKFELKQINNKEQYVVSLDRKHCSCGLWELSGTPYYHAVSAIYYVHINPNHYVHDWLTVERAKKAYEFVLEPMNGENLWERSTAVPLLPPIARRLAGRPKKLRRREAHEGNKKTKVSKLGKPLTCSQCKQSGHNRKTCKGEHAENRARKIKLVRGATTMEGSTSTAAKLGPKRKTTEVYTSTVTAAKVDSRARKIKLVRGDTAMEGSTSTAAKLGPKRKIIEVDTSTVTAAKHLGSKRGKWIPPGRSCHPSQGSSSGAAIEKLKPQPTRSKVYTQGSSTEVAKKIPKPPISTRSSSTAARSSFKPPLTRSMSCGVKTRNGTSKP